MTLSEYRKTLSWQGAMELAPGLINLAESLPASEEMGLSFQLRQLMVDLPAAVAGDLLKGTNTRQDPVLRLVTAIELIDRVYPALDTAATRTAADRLAERLMGAAFNEETTPATPPAPEHRMEPVGEPASIPVVEEAPAPAPAPVVPEPVPEPAPQAAPAPAPTHVAVQPDGGAVPAAEEQHVQPNSVE